ncbi:MAG: glycoside hydrolase family 2 TIM barrel-domain containing protein [Oceanipulchritudo sp.]
MIRIEENLCSGWQFQLEGDAQPVLPVNLPHTWNSRDLPEAGTRPRPPSTGRDSAAFAGYGVGEGDDYHRGSGRYTRILPPIPDSNGRRVWLRFEAANQDTSVKLNGEEVGQHLGGYTAFQFDLTDLLHADRENRLEVVVSNAHNPDVPPIGGDLGHFGGIYRPVWLITLKETHFTMADHGGCGVYWQTSNVSLRQASLQLSATVSHCGSSPRRVVWEASLIDPEGTLISNLQSTATIASGQTCDLRLETEVILPSLWSPEAPVCHTLQHQLRDADTGEGLDSLSTPLGFRSFRIDAEQGFFLNDDHCFLRGVGRHQDFEDLGYATPLATLVEDTRQIREMGCNAMRSHYPHADAVYAECDRSGLICWVKIPVMDQMAESPAFLRNARRQLHEMIQQLRNHPSILFWGYHCEILGGADWFWPQPQDPKRLEEHFAAARLFCKTLDADCKRIDPDRITLNDAHSDPNPRWYQDTGLLQVNDANSWNIYHGWYHRNLSEVKSWLQETRAYAPDKPYILAEFGAGVDPRIHAREPTVFDMSPEYADRFHRVYREAIRDLPWLAGVFIWTWSDFQRTSLGDGMGHINNKGMLDNARRPKDAFFQYQSWWSRSPMVHIAGQARTLRAGFGDALEESIRVYSNQPEVELFLNGTSQGVRMVEDGAADWLLALPGGRHQLLAVAGPVRGLMETIVRLYPDDLRQWQAPGEELCLNLGQSRCDVLDPLTRRIWLPDQPYAGPGTCGYVGGQTFRSWPDMPAWEGIREGTNRHIRGGDMQPVFQTFRIGIDRWRADVPAGGYEVELLFAEPFDASTRRGDRVPHGAGSDGRRVFDVLLQGQCVLPALDLASTVGELTAFRTSFRTRVQQNGLELRFVPGIGSPILNGVRLLSI